MGTFTTHGIYKPDAGEGGVTGLVNANWDELEDVIADVEAGGGGGGGTALTPLVINPMDAPYNAVGNGSTDDLTKINNAISDINAAGGGTLYLTKLHAVKGKIVHKNDVLIVGAHKNAGFKAVATFTGSIMLEGSSVSWAQVIGCKFDGNSLVATGISIGAGGTNAGHNYITHNRMLGFTTVAIDAGATVGGSETHVAWNNITSSPSGILSGPDNHIVHNNMGSITAEGIQLNSGGNEVVDNHIVTTGSSAHCLKVTSGFVNIITNNYFDSSSTESAPMVLIATTTGKTSADSILANNSFFAQNLSADNTYPAISIDQSGGGTIDNWMIVANQGRAKTSFRWSAIVTISGTVSNCLLDENRFMYCTTIGNMNPSHLGINTIYDGTTYMIGRRRQGKIVSTQSGGGTKTLDAAFGDIYAVSVTDGTAFTMGAPSNPLDGMRITIVIQNASGGTMGTVTWNSAFRFDAATAPTNPANGKERQVSLWYSNTDSKWHEFGRSTGDV